MWFSFFNVYDFFYAKMIYHSNASVSLCDKNTHILFIYCNMNSIKHFPNNKIYNI